MKKLLLLLLVGILLLGSISAFNWNNNTILHYSFNSSSGTTITDDTGNFTGVAIGGEDADWVTGAGAIIGQARRFNEPTDINDYVNTTFAPVYGLTNDFTYSLWFNNTRPRTTGADSAFGSVACGAGAEEFRLQENGGGTTWRFRIVDGGITLNMGVTANLSTTTFNHVVISRNTGADNFSIYVNGVNTNNYTDTLTDTVDLTGCPIFLATNNNLGATSGFMNGTIDLFGVWNRSLNQSEVNELYNAGAGLAFGGGTTGIATVSLISPSNASVFSTTNTTFISFHNITTGIYNWTNSTYYIWNSNGTIFNVTTLSLNGTNNQSSFNLSGLTIGNYIWNVKGGYGNSTFLNYTFADENFTFTIGATLSSSTYNTQTYETARERFNAIFDIVSGSQISLAQLVYNGTNYTITNLTQTSTTITLTKDIDIPLNLAPLANQTDNFFFRFTYGGGSVQESSTLQQNVLFINFQNCNATYPVQSLNFTFFNEINQTKLVGATNPTNFESSWKYWLGNGDINKTYTFQNLSSSFVNYTFCIYPYIPQNYTFKVNGDIEYSATSFRENEYHFRNATLSNVSSDVLLYLIHTDFATKFFLTFRQGTSLISGATVTVQKFFTGLGTFNTVSILSTDDNGESTMWQEVDKTYRYSIIKDGVLLGIVERVSICSVSPCALTISIDADAPNPYEPYYNFYSQNVLSNLSYNKTSHIVTYDFIDITGLANYFRLVVKQGRLNDTGTTICDSTSYSTAGSLTCNVTGYSGEFVATGYISRSPEKVDKILNFLTDDEAIAGLGLIGIFLIMALLITIVFAAAVIGKGSPSVVLGFLAIGILGLKIAGLFPFTWVVVVSLEVLILYIMSKVKS